MLTGYHTIWVPSHNIENLHIHCHENLKSLFHNSAVHFGFNVYIHSTHAHADIQRIIFANT
jgi:hypothetical protein